MLQAPVERDFHRDGTLLSDCKRVFLFYTFVNHYTVKIGKHVEPTIHSVLKQMPRCCPNHFNPLYGSYRNSFAVRLLGAYARANPRHE